MKTSILVSAIVSLMLASCGNGQTTGENAAHDHGDGTHQHEDGAVHQDHETATPAQESFSVEGDSAAVEHDEHGHSHVMATISTE